MSWETRLKLTALMNILFSRFPLESAHGGAEVQTLSLMQGLRDRGHEVGFLGSCPVMLNKCKQLGIDHWSLMIGKPPVTKFGALTFLWRQLLMKKNLIRATESYFVSAQYDKAIIMISLTEKLLLTPWAIKHGIKVIWLEHDRVGRWLTMNPWLPRLRRLSKNVMTAVVSDLSRNIYIKLGWPEDHTISIPNGIDIDRFTPLSENRSEPDFSNIKIGCVARLTHDKGVDVLIDAITDLPNITLTIVGEGREESSIRKQTQRANRQTSKQVNIVPPTNNITKLYQDFDIIVLPSREHDPFGLVIAEAMAAGIPTICTDKCGIAPHLETDESLIVRANDVNDLRNAIIKLSDRSSWLAYAKKGSLAVREKFCLTNMIEAYETLITAKPMTKCILKNNIS